MQRVEGAKSMIKFVPVNGYVLISVSKPEEKKTKGGIVIPKAAVPVLNTAIVEVTGDSSLVEVGETIYINSYGPIKVNIEGSGKEYHVIKEEDILGIER